MLHSIKIYWVVEISSQKVLAGPYVVESQALEHRLRLGAGWNGCDEIQVISYDVQVDEDHVWAKDYLRVA